MSRHTTVNDGLRSAGGAVSAIVPHEAARKPVPAREMKQGEVLYQARNGNYRLLLRADRPKRTDDGTIVHGETVYVQFRDSQFVTSDPWIIEQIESKENYGLNRDFWRAEELRTAAAENDYQDFVEKIRTNDYLRERLTNDLLSSDGMLADLTAPKDKKKSS